jgi:RimJ/RimL family protein N-acetyltransferase/acyl carrier protein
LRPIEPTDFASLYAIELAPDNIHRWRFRGSTPSPDQYARSLFDGVLATFVVQEIERGSIVGVATCYNADLKNGLAYIAAATASAYQRRPAALEGVEMLVSYCFRNWQFRKLYLESPEYCYTDFAAPSLPIFRREGELKDHEYFDGRYWDRLILAIYRTDWDDLQSIRRSRQVPVTGAEFISAVRDLLSLETGTAIDLSTHIEDLGLDSLSLYSLVVLVEEFAAEAALDLVIAQWRSLGDIYAWLEQRVSHLR